MRYKCKPCNCYLQWYSDEFVSDKITEIVYKDSPLSYRPREIYSMVETDKFDIVKYDYYLVRAKYECPICKKTVVNILYCDN